MTSIVTFDPAQLPAFAKRRSGKSAMAKALTGGGEAGGKRISIKGGVFRLMSAGKEIANIEDRHLDVVMVNAAAKVNRIFYAAAYDSEVPVLVRVIAALAVISNVLLLCWQTIWKVVCFN